MIKYDSPAQLSIEEFKTPFQSTLLTDNKWVKLSKVVPWDKFASAYMSMMNIDFWPARHLPTDRIGSINHKTS